MVYFTGVDKVQSVHLADFGVSKVTSTLIPNAQTHMVGTLEFLAPEGIGSKFAIIIFLQYVKRKMTVEIMIQLLLTVKRIL